MRRILDIAAVLLVLLGGVVVPVLGWLLGIALLWSSPSWTRREKLIGTFLVPGGLSLTLVIIGLGVTGQKCSARCTAVQTPLPVEILLAVAFALAAALPIITAIHLIRHRRPNQGTTVPTPTT